MNNYLDKAFDIITYSTVFICFIAAIVFVVKAVANGEGIYNASLLIGLGIAMSLFIFYIKSWVKK